jgi:hypothetical protein
MTTDPADLHEMTNFDQTKETLMVVLVAVRRQLTVANTDVGDAKKSNR